MVHDLPRAGLALVETVVHRHFRHLYGVVSRDELVSHGSLGVVKAARSYKPDKGLAFSTYAGYRIRAAIIDGLREDDRLSRRDRRMVSAAERAWSELAQGLGREPTDAEVAHRLEVDRQELERAYKLAFPYSIEHEYREDNGPGTLITLADKLPDPAPSPEEQALADEASKELAQHLAALPGAESVAVTLRAEGETGTEIGRKLEVSESRVCQLHAQGIRRLRRRLGPEQLAA